MSQSSSVHIFSGDPDKQPMVVNDAESSINLDHLELPGEVTGD